jgi:hypothetical protein
LPEPTTSLIPTLKVSKAIGWPVTKWCSFLSATANLRGCRWIS